MPEIQCFLIEPTGQARRYLRRYTHWDADDACPVNGNYHHAQVPIEDGQVVESEGGTYRIDPMEWPHDDARWPTHCACGYEFQEADAWQLFYDRVYARADTGEETTLRGAPAGAMWYADWITPGTGETEQGPGSYRGPDGRCLMVQLPDGFEWCVDGPATNGPGWTRTGTPPHVTATPSIGRQDKQGGWIYHGWLRDGVLVDA